MTRALILALSALGLLAGCEADDSLPTRPRTGSLLTPDEREKANAEQRSLEKPGRDLPTNRTDLPGQSLAPTQNPVLTLDSPPADQPQWLGFTGPSGVDAIGRTKSPMSNTIYTRDTYPGLIPHVPLNPGTTPMTGSTPIPGGDWAVDHSWGQNVTLTQYPHRDWPQTTAHYQTANVVHNPVYYFDVEERLPVPQNNGTYMADVHSALIEIPWFFINTALLPLEMVLECPFALRTTSVPTPDPDFNGHLPAGPTVPTPVPGVLKWEYPFLNPDGTVRQNDANTRP